MNRSTTPDFDQRIADWLEEDPDQAPREAMATVFAAYPSIPQRRAWRALGPIGLPLEDALGGRVPQDRVARGVLGLADRARDVLLLVGREALGASSLGDQGERIGHGRSGPGRAAKR